MLLSYSSDGVYLYSTHDDTRTKSKETAMLRPNKKRRLPSPSKEPTTSSSSAPGSSISNTLMEEDIERFVDEDDGDSDEDADMDSEDCSRNEEDDEEEDDDSVDEHGTTRDFKFYPDVPVVMPRSRFAGHCNVETVKDGECCKICRQPLVLIICHSQFSGARRRIRGLRLGRWSLVHVEQVHRTAS